MDKILKAVDDIMFEVNPDNNNWINNKRSKLVGILEELVKPSHSIDFAKCADDILVLDLCDAVVNKHGCLVAIMKRHFA